MRSQIQPPFSRAEIGDVADPRPIDVPTIESAVKDGIRQRQVMVRVRRHPIRPLVDRSQRLSLQAAADPFVTDVHALSTEFADDPRAPIAALALRSSISGVGESLVGR